MAKLPDCGGLAAKFSANGHRLLTVGSGGARVWDVATGKPLTEPLPYEPADTGEGATADLSPDGELVVSAVGHEVRLYSVRNGKQGRVFRHTQEHGPEDPASTILNAKFSPDGRSLVTAGQDKTARVWSLETGKETFRATHRHPVTYAALSPDGGRLVASAFDTFIWDVKSGRLATPEPIRSFYREPSFSADWKQVLVRMTMHAFVHDVATGKEVHSATAFRDGAVLSDAELSADGTHFVVVDEGEADVWRTFHRDEDGRRFRRTGTHNPIRSASFSPDGKLLVTCSGSSTPGADADSTGIWDVANHQLVAKLHGGQTVEGATFSADGRYLALSCVPSFKAATDGVDGYTLIFEVKPTR